MLLLVAHQVVAVELLRGVADSDPEVGGVVAALGGLREHRPARGRNADLADHPTGHFRKAMRTVVAVGVDRLLSRSWRTKSLFRPGTGDACSPSAPKWTVTSNCDVP